MKKCSKCEIEKPLTEFYKDKTKKDGLKSCCKICSEKTKKTYRQNNFEKVRDSSKKRYDKYYKNNSNDILEKNRIWRKNNFEIFKESKKKSDSKFHSNNPTYVNDYRKYKRDTNHLYKLTGNVRSRLNGFFKLNNYNKSNNTFKIIGCLPHELKNYLEKKFTEGMSWDNYGKWQIDHIIPLSSCNSEEELYNLCHFTNLQPMWATENAKKGSKII
jgi:hypothetical protein